jgi:hypothetical protein
LLLHIAGEKFINLNWLLPVELALEADFLNDERQNQKDKQLEDDSNGHKVIQAEVKHEYWIFGFGL